MRATMNEILTANVRAVNRANEYGATLYRTLAELFRPLVGTQVLKKDGTLLAKIKALLPELPCTAALHVYKHGSECGLAWVVKTSEMIGDTCSCVYHESTVYVGDLQAGVLTAISTPFQGRTNYSVSEVEKARKRYEEARQAAEEARNALYPFGEYDH